QLASQLRSSLSLGRFSLSQNFSLNDASRDPRTFPVDTLAPLPGSSERRGQWSTSLGFQQRLIGTSTLSPNVTLGGEFLRNDSTMGTVHAPTRVDFGASLRTDVFGFWPGVGPFSAVRHKLSPSFSYSYSPATQAD